MTNANAVDGAKAIQKQAPVTIGSILVARQKQLASVLPKSITPERFARIAMTSILRDKRLQACSPESLYACILQAATMGLEIDSGLGFAYLVPYKGAATLQVGYKGLKEMMYHSGMVASVAARAVHEGDDFDWEYGLTDKLTHRPAGDPDAKMTHVYAVVRLKGAVDAPIFDVMTRADIDAVRKRSRAGNDGPWVTDYEEMAKKTVLRRIAKLAPLSPAAHRIIANDEMTDAGLPQTDPIELDDQDIVITTVAEPK